MLGKVVFKKTSTDREVKKGRTKLAARSVNGTWVCIFPSAVALRNAKTGRINAESVHLVDGKFSEIIAFALRGRKRNEFIFEFSVQHFHESFTALSRALMVQQIGFTPYSLMRGGAIWFFVN